MKANLCVKIVENNLIFESEISVELARQIIRLTIKDPENLGSVESTLEETTKVKHITERDFMAKTDAKRNPDRIVALGVYWLKHKQKKDFRREDIVDGFQTAGVAIPKNLSRDLQWAEKNGWLARVANDETAYFVTTKGEAVVKAGFPVEMVKKTSARR